MAPMTNRVKVWKYFRGLFIAPNNFAFEVEAIPVLESFHLKNWMGKIGLNGPMTNRVKV